MKEINSDGICPVVLLEIYREWKSLKEGEEEDVIIRTPWEASVQALEKWCNETGNIFLSYEKQGNKIVIRLKLKK
ncbi:sulfurtransferase TusA family protein [Acidianus infernus]|uniref:Sulfurtransferase TusA family protein n=1 Tax=Acidianus infernus TaxID=12915 RepID=A0A6A9QDY8_ACIIN|nr:sulfurtransferase TusA family protein [Acidianus infernus]MCY0873965.1 sulfurtransferase TusA family protein [Acidianus infernus]MCY0883926.1 sulfurtransferase TusA family protein [Acidianus infernus]MUM64003.1 sulfurtransferase TusA family protein [Acidianus infernus]